MDPLRGRAEQISARTAAVIHMNTKVMMYEDLKCVNGTLESEVPLEFTKRLPDRLRVNRGRSQPCLWCYRPSPASCRALSWAHIPNTADEVHCDETRGETFNEVPAPMELL